MGMCGGLVFMVTIVPFFVVGVCSMGGVAACDRVWPGLFAAVAVSGACVWLGYGCDGGSDDGSDDGSEDTDTSGLILNMNQNVP